MIQKKGAILAENNQTRQKIAQRKRDTEQRKEAKAKKDMKSKAEREIEAIVEKGKEAKAEEEDLEVSRVGTPLRSSCGPRKPSKPSLRFPVARRATASTTAISGTLGVV